MKSNINEGLKENALEHLIIPLLTVDEYESKIDDKRVIVVGFFVFDKDPADDLANFIDKSSSKVLDTEVSPAPTPEGYYVVFLEFLRNSEFPEILMNIIKEVENLCKRLNWQMQCPGSAEPIDVSEESLRENIILDERLLQDEPDKQTTKRKSKKKKKKQAKISEDSDFWINCDADKILFEMDHITFMKNNLSWTYQLCEDIPISSINLLENAKVNQLQSVLGPSYNVWQMQDALVVEHNDVVKVLKYQD